VIFLPELLPKHDPNIILAQISKIGYIQRLWVHGLFHGPMAPHNLIGSHICDIITPTDCEKILSLLNSDILLIRDQITLVIGVSHKTRLLRIFKIDEATVLVYIQK